MNTISIIKSLLFSLQWLPKAKMVCGSSKITFKVPEQVVKLTLSVDNRAEVFQVESIVAPASFLDEKKEPLMINRLVHLSLRVSKDGERPISSLWKTHREVPLTFDSFFFAQNWGWQHTKTKLISMFFRLFSLVIMVWCRDKDGSSLFSVESQLRRQNAMMVTYHWSDEWWESCWYYRWRPISFDLNS
mgnify:CR=1 FL=1